MKGLGLLHNKWEQRLALHFKSISCDFNQDVAKTEIHSPIRDC